MDQAQLNDLIARADKVKGGTVQHKIESNGKIVTLDCEFVGYSRAFGVSESDKPKKFTIIGVIKAPDGTEYKLPLKNIVTQIESNRQS